eukprot:9237280-Lingulodinium_polyedra.AAC.1
MELGASPLGRSGPPRACPFWPSHGPRAWNFGVSCQCPASQRGYLKSVDESVVFDWEFIRQLMGLQ